MRSYAQPAPGSPHIRQEITRGLLERHGPAFILEAPDIGMIRDHRAGTHKNVPRGEHDIKAHRDWMRIAALQGDVEGVTHHASALARKLGSETKANSVKVPIDAKFYGMSQAEYNGLLRKFALPGIQAIADNPRGYVAAADDFRQAIHNRWVEKERRADVQSQKWRLAAAQHDRMMKKAGR